MIFPSTIISGPQNLIEKKLTEILKELETPLNINNPDHFRLDQNTGWGISEVRKIPLFLSQFSNKYPNKAVIIYQAQNLGPEAQNALLKTLEEPGKNNFIFLLCSNHHQLLPTILSRSQLIRLKSVSSQSKTQKLIIPDKNPKTAINQADSLALSKEEIAPFLKLQLQLHQQQLLTKPSPQQLHYIQNLIKSLQMIKANVDPYSALDYFFLA